MDKFLEKNCQNLIRKIQEGGYSFEDIIEDPIYCIFGSSYSPEDVINFVKKYNEELNVSIKFKFADEYYKTNIKKFDPTFEEKIRLAVRYLALELAYSSPIIGDKLKDKKIMDKDKFDKFRKDFQNLSKDEQIEIFNDFCDKNGHEDEKIYPMEKFDEVFSGTSPSEMFEIISCNYDRIDKSDDYFVDTIGSLITFNRPYDGIIWKYIGGIYNYMKK